LSVATRRYPTRARTGMTAITCMSTTGGRTWGVTGRRTPSIRISTWGTTQRRRTRMSGERQRGITRLAAVLK
jgi:hypothetical protein